MNPTTSAEAAKQMQEFGSTRKSLSDIYAGAEQEAGVGEAQKRANELRNLAAGTEKLIKGVDPSVTGRLQGSMATEAQRQRLVNLETQPLSELYQTQTGAYETGQSEYNNALAKAEKMAQQRYGSDTEKYNTLKDLYSTLLGQETAAEEKRRYEAEQAAAEKRAAEERRRWDEQFAATLAQQRAQANVTATFGSGNLSDILKSSISKQSNQDSQQQADQSAQKEAYNSVKNMLNSGDSKRIERELRAIEKSAGYGNMRDKMKLTAVALITGKPLRPNALANKVSF